MIKISRDEVRKIAQISYISLPDNEVEPMIQEIEAVLNYAQCVIDVAGKSPEAPSIKNVNVFRKDITEPQSPDVLLAQAPEKADRFFVVPMILDN